MNDGMLSQDEINALLNNEEKSSEAETKAGENPKTSASEMENLALSEHDKDILGEIGNISMGSAATTLSILLGHKVSITTPTVTLTSMPEVRKEYPIPYLIIAVDYTSAIRGSNLFAIKQNDALIISDLMMGESGENPPTELTELYMSAVTEAMNQMMGATATSMSTIFKDKVDIAPPRVSVVDFANQDQITDLDQETTEPVVKICFRMQVSDLIDSEIMQILTLSVAKELVAKLMNTNQPPNEGQNAQTTGQTQAVQAGSPTSEVSYTPPKPVGQTSNVPVQSVQFSPLNAQNMPPLEGNIGLLMDVPLQVTVELGRTKKVIRDILDLGPGSVVELDKLAGEPVDVFVNTKLIAKGEVVVIDENFGVRITEIVNPLERISNLQ